jgi:alkanesulfonate monooxygenase SsuD/methylene tetrahydromethanopterin reductase-like flavin-dependent oxidoreductase (luciferase family)
MLKLSVLDQSTAAEGVAEPQAIRDTIELARLCEDLGYHRFWVSEHHNHPTIVGTAPEIVMAAIAQSTERIRIGSAGVMLPHYAPYTVAEQVRVLDAIAPGRIDHFPANVRDLIHWVRGEPLVDGHPYGSLIAHPQSETVPEIWMLGTSDYGARVAAHFGIPYCFAHFITDGGGVEYALKLYRSEYQPSPGYPEPKANICVWALAAETDAEAKRLFQTRAYSKLMRNRGRLQPLQTPETAASHPYTESDRAFLDDLEKHALIGTPDRVADMLRAMAESAGVDEIVVLTWTHDQADRRKSYELLAKEFT